MRMHSTGIARTFLQDAYISHRYSGIRIYAEARSYFMLRKEISSERVSRGMGSYFLYTFPPRAISADQQ
jgi:hypothetical protein